MPEHKPRKGVVYQQKSVDVCRYCGGTRSKVVRTQRRAGMILREHLCLTSWCMEVFYTREIVPETPPAPEVEAVLLPNSKKKRGKT